MGGRGRVEVVPRGLCGQELFLRAVASDPLPQVHNEKPKKVQPVNHMAIKAMNSTDDLDPACPSHGISDTSGHA